MVTIARDKCGFVLTRPGLALIGVAVAYDRRRYARDGRLIGKTTVYRLAPPATAQRMERLAAWARPRAARRHEAP